MSKLLNSISSESLFGCSDHSSVIRKINVTTSNGIITICCASFNVLYPKWLDMNIKNKDGTPGHIGKYFPHLVGLHDMNQNPDQRTLMNVEYVNYMLDSFGVDILGIQEAGNEFTTELWKKLDRSKFGVIYPWTIDPNGDPRVTNTDFQMVIYNKKKFDHNVKSSHIGYYPNRNKRIMNVSFTDKNSGSEFRFINTHVEFKCLNVIVDYLNKIRIGNRKFLSVILVGDFNTDTRFASSDIPDYIVPSQEGTIVLVRRETDNHFAIVKLDDVNKTHINTNGSDVVYDFIYYFEKIK